ncbi:MAG: Ribosomal RNA small subunit methyltransferase D [Chlamydiae bacterium]|nr:Ribosomal RNA small subunit methyltransferase D [Chlamydiota bacterium]
MHIIGGQFKKQKLQSPKGEQTRPTKNILRETFYNICMPYIEGAIFVDLFAGSGAMGLEALSRGAKHSYFIEAHRNAYIAIEKNIQHLKVKKSATLIKGDVFQKLKCIDSRCDIIFADPPYAKENQASYAVRLLEFLNRHSLLKEGGRLYIEIGSDENIDLSSYSSFEFIKKRLIGSSALVEMKQLAN